MLVDCIHLFVVRDREALWGMQVLNENFPPTSIGSWVEEACVCVTQPDCIQPRPLPHPNLVNGRNSENFGPKTGPELIAPLSPGLD